MSVASFVFGDFVLVDRPDYEPLQLSPEEAEQLAQALILAAARVRQLRTLPPTAPLPLAEPFALEVSKS